MGMPEKEGSEYLPFLFLFPCSGVDIKQSKHSLSSFAGFWIFILIKGLL